MQKRLSALFFTGLTLFSLFVFSTHTVFAKAIATEGSLTISESEEYNEDLFLSGDVVTINGTVHGDVYVGGGVVTVNGTITGDLLIGGGTVDIAGKIGDDLRVGGGVITVRSAEIGDNVTLFGGRITVANDVTVGGSTVVAGGMVSLENSVGRELYVGAGTVTLNNSVEGDVMVGGNDIILGPHVNFKKDLTYASDKPLQKDSGATIAGEITQQDVNLEHSWQGMRDYSAPRAQIRGLGLGFSIWSFFSALVVGLLVLYFFRESAKDVVTTIVQKPWSSLGWGLIVLLLTFPVIILLMITVIGIPLAFILMGIFFLALYLVKIFIGLLFGTYVVQYMNTKSTNVYLAFVLGLLLYSVLTMIPVLNAFISIVSMLFALGALFMFMRKRLFSDKA